MFSLIEKSGSKSKDVTEIVQTLLDYHFSDLGKHMEHVCLYTKLLCICYNNMYPDHAIPVDRLPLIYEAASLHDIGLIAIPDSLLQKDENLITEADREEYENHTVIGTEIIEKLYGTSKKDSVKTDILRNVCLYHHEREDGKGYPKGLKGDQIPIEAKVVRLAEVYDSLTINNYSKPRSHEEAMNMILSGQCGAFDSEWLKCLEKCSRDMQMFLECSNNNAKRLLLESVFGQNRKNYWKKKRVFDLIVCVPAMIVLSPLFLLLCAAIWIDDPHASPIFCQTRVGRHRKNFTMYKFRTMFKDAEKRKKELEALNEKSGPVFKMKADPRITRMGKFLRKTSLDELPQLINVIKGDMTLVGPRPPLPEEVAKYSQYIGMRLSVTPGMTCIWQVQPKRDDISFEEWMDMDLAYIGKRTLWEDLKLIFLTVRRIFSADGE